jgi:hypothetical protein
MINQNEQSYKAVNCFVYLLDLGLVNIDFKLRVCLLSCLFDCSFLRLSLHFHRSHRVFVLHSNSYRIMSALHVLWVLTKTLLEIRPAFPVSTSARSSPE